MNDSLKLLEFDEVKKLYAKYCFSDGGKEEIMGLQPNEDPWDELSLIEDTLKALRFFEFPTYHDYNVKPLLDKVTSGQILEPRELLRIKDFINGCNAFKGIGRKLDASRLKIKLLELKNLPDILNEINRIVSEDGEIKNNASRKLREIREEKRRITSELKRLSERVKDKYRQFLQDEIIVFRDGRYLLAVKSSYRPKVKGIVHNSSSTGMTLYIEPEELIPFNDRKKILDEEERREVNRILREITTKILYKIEAFKENFSIISHIDSLYARAMYVLKENANVIHPVKSGEIELIEARHPLISDDKVVPINVKIGREKSGLVITGPNMGGKTVTLKTIGLFTALVMAGFPVKADQNSKISIFKKILSDIGEEQNIQLSLSTFSSHVKRISKILQEADENSLVLIDELGTGTDPIEGSALALAIVEELIRKGCKFVITTHMTPLKLFAIERKEIESASVEFDPQTLKPTYHVLMGVPGASHAFEIAASLGIDDEIIERARYHMSGGSVEVESIIRKLQEEVRSLKIEKKKVEEEKEKLEKERVKYEKEYKKLKNTKIEEMDKQLKDLTNQVDDVMKKLESAIHVLKKKNVNDLRKVVKELYNEKKKLKKLNIPSPSAHVKEGDYVRLKGGTSIGKVVSDKGETVFVDFGTMKMELPKTSLEIAKAPEPKMRLTYIETPKNVLEKPEIDIRGLTVEQAEPLVINFIDKLMLSDFEKGYIIHGKGTGRLAAGVWQILRRDPRVKNYRFGTPGEGGTGVTVVEV